MFWEEAIEKLTKKRMQVYQSRTIDKKYLQSVKQARKINRRESCVLYDCLFYIQSRAVARTFANFLDRELTIVEELYIFVICGGAGYTSPESCYGKYRDSIN